jgi:hypothetical protein
MKPLLRLLVATILMAGLVAAASPIAASPATAQKQQPTVIMADGPAPITTCDPRLPCPAKPIQR